MVGMGELKWETAILLFLFIVEVVGREQGRLKVYVFYKA